MWVADMDFAAPPAVVQALKERVEHGVFGYTQVPEKLNPLIVKRMAARYGWMIQPEWIIWLPGVVSAMNMACAAFGGPTAPIVTTTPIYPPFLTAPSNQGKKLITIPMVEVNGRACLNFDRIESVFKKGVGLFMLCSPHNPCGTLFTKMELCRLTDLCQTHDVILCSDEIHADFVLDPNQCHIPTASVSEAAQNRTVTLMAPSKTYNIPGLGASFAIIGDPDLRKQFQDPGKGMVPHVNLLGLTAAQAAYEHCDDWLFQLIDYLRENRDRVYESVNQMKRCSVNPIASTFLAWIDVTQTGIRDPVRFFEQAGVGLSDGAFFGQQGFVRMNFGCPKALLEKGLHRMGKALNASLG